ncbi:hypothetical protein LEP1GSC059_1318 [Leptospira noguchii serovar Panama str. CZ214]|uniref:Uncharacterized protein n=1 Tax=Leptospira noguchii serovar Panama str. CZ214 TaxID=1001595 RepID=T0FHC2_9LEPT|nr:hypothetical protein LEP1GSC059_1318 [Leptospira noguchii serovar Panama str. CZ214]
MYESRKKLEHSSAIHRESNIEFFYSQDFSTNLIEESF